MWYEFVQAKELWIGGTLERIDTFQSTPIVDMQWFRGWVSFIGQDFSTGSDENNLDIRVRSGSSIEFQIVGSSSRWRLLRPNFVQSAASQSSFATDSVSTPANT